MAQRHSSSFPFDALLWTLNECRMMLLHKYCSQKKLMITKMPDTPQEISLEKDYGQKHLSHPINEQLRYIGAQR